MLSIGAFIYFFFPCPRDFPCNYKPGLSPVPGFSCSSQRCWDSWPYWSTAPPWQWAWDQVLINTYLDSCWTVKKYSCFQHVLASYQSPGGKTCGAYCDSLIPCLSRHSNHGPGVEPGFIQHPWAAQGRQQDNLPVLPAFSAEVYLTWRDFRKMGLDPAVVLAKPAGGV